ncbi:MaoC/PaaZ C-terminal domain-containing protein [Vibrio diabolicus]|uniref:MaoC/PaaZ C-terminal domain-containing protein n=1 Tax=Vibrio diabolicus TaxID=50719 RepID=UPI002174EC07|nr:MaoC/PaaZ C-terminal domain-containing protein [Vibrio diabolicus]
MNLGGSVPIESIEIGMSVSYSQTITDADIKQFAGLSGDHNPVHLDEVYAAESRYKRRIAHGLISGSFFFRFIWHQITWSRMCLRWSVI